MTGTAVPLGKIVASGWAGSNQDSPRRSSSLQEWVRGTVEDARRVEAMGLPRMGSPRGATSRRVALWSALAVGGILPSVGCQVEYAGMTLPSGKYMHDDVQYFPSGPDFPWANTQAATQRARMRAMGIEPPPPPGGFTQPAAAGALNPVQNQMGRPTDVNEGPMGAVPNAPAPPPPAPGIGPVVPAAEVPPGNLPPGGGAPGAGAPGAGGPGAGAGGRVPPPPPPGGNPEP